MDETVTEERITLPSREEAWAVVHARPRAEKKVAEYFRTQHLRHYLPLRRKKHRYGNRERTFMTPLFPGYLFCVIEPARRSMVAQNRHVANLLDVVDQATLVEQLRQIQAAVTAGDIAEVLPYLVSGSHVRVTSGPLRGLEGVIQRVKGQTRVVINVDMIRQAMAVEVDSAVLEPA